jgi:hypothetical protein
MLAELKDLVQKGLFTAVSFELLRLISPLEITETYSFVQAETKQIMKKRTAFETALVRRVAKKSDFVRYAAYEMGLEQLRRKRVERLRAYLEPPMFKIDDSSLQIYHLRHLLCQTMPSSADNSISSNVRSKNSSQMWDYGYNMPRWPNEREHAHWSAESQLGTLHRIAHPDIR